MYGFRNHEMNAMSLVKFYWDADLDAEKFKKDFNDKYYYYDINSLYPSCMIKKYPKPSSAKYSQENTQYYIKKYHGVSDIKISCPYMKYPLLPYRSRKSGKLLFPYGKFRGHYSHIELCKALSLGYKILKVYSSIYYTKTFYPFKKYIEDLYKKRLYYKEQDNEIYSKIFGDNVTDVTQEKAKQMILAYNFYDIIDDEAKKFNRTLISIRQFENENMKY
jgi:hypothetical protein